MIKSSSKGQKLIINILKYALLIFGAFVALVPIVSCVITAFKTVDEYQTTNVMVLPKSWLYFDNLAGITIRLHKVTRPSVT